jgi:predicted nuclease of predicted toxin-antitoxin system
MKFLLDQGLPRTTVLHLAARGIDAEHVGDLGMARAADSQILDAAFQRQAVVVTLDADFHALLAASHAAGPSVIRIRIEGLKGEQVAAIIARVMTAAGPELEAGAAVSVTKQAIRVRFLPIGRRA